MTEDGRAGRWLVLVVRVPAESSRHRVAVWRELRRAGAVSLGQGCWQYRTYRRLRAGSSGPRSWPGAAPARSWSCRRPGAGTAHDAIPASALDLGSTIAAHATYQSLNRASRPGFTLRT